MLYFYGNVLKHVCSEFCSYKLVNLLSATFAIFILQLSPKSTCNKQAAEKAEQTAKNSLRGYSGNEQGDLI